MILFWCPARVTPILCVCVCACVCVYMYIKGVKKQSTKNPDTLSYIHAMYLQLYQLSPMYLKLYQLSHLQSSACIYLQLYHAHNSLPVEVVGCEVEAFLDGGAARLLKVLRILCHLDALQPVGHCRVVQRAGHQALAGGRLLGTWFGLGSGVRVRHVHVYMTFVMVHSFNSTNTIQFIIHYVYYDCVMYNTLCTCTCIIPICEIQPSLPWQLS